MNFDIQKQFPHCHTFEGESTDHDHLLLCHVSTSFKEDRICETRTGLIKTKTAQILTTMLHMIRTSNKNNKNGVS